MHLRLRYVLILVAVVSPFTGCEWDRRIAPDKDPPFVQARSSAGAAPSELSSTAQSQSEILLTWQDNVPNESGFEVHRSVSGASGTFTLHTTTSANVASSRDSGLTAATEYCYMVRAVLTRGKKTTYAAFSSVSCARTLPLPIPAAPSNTTVKPISSSSISVAWTAAPNAQDGFRVERSASIDGPWAIAATTGATTRTHTDAPLATELAVCYRVIAFTISGDSPPSIVDCSSPPAAPTHLVANRYDPSTIDLAWTDNSIVEDAYEVRRAGVDGVWNVIATLPANAAGHRDSGVSSGSRYSYAVFARKDGGYSDSAYTSESGFGDPPTAPLTIVVSPVPGPSVYVGWSGAQNAGGYRVERSTDGGSSWVTAGTLSGTVQQFQDVGRTAEQPVWYRVLAFNNTRESPPSPVGTTTPPAPPTDVVFDDQTFEFKWTDNSSVEDGYELYYYYYVCETDDGECYQFWFTPRLPPNTTSFRVGVYAYLSGVRALKDGGYSSWAR